MKNTLHSGVLLALLALASTALGDEDRVRNAVERAHDRQDLRQDRRQIADDQSDLDRLLHLEEQLGAARSAGDVSGIARVKHGLAAYLRTELGESKHETAQASRELRESRRELRSDRREIRENRAEGASRRARADDRRDLRDDRRDKRDDRADRNEQRADLEAKQRIAEELKNMPPGDDAAAYDQLNGMLDELIVLARAEQRENAEELVEDRRELREDRRETREDRRQRN